MAIFQNISYTTKSYLNENASVPAANKVQASDMNEIKTVVNNNSYYTHRWNLAGTETGTTAITIPTGTREVIAIVKVNNNGNIHFTIDIPTDVLTTTSKGFNAGYYEGSGINARARVMATNTSIYLSQATLNSSDVLSSTVIEVYYR